MKDLKKKLVFAVSVIAILFIVFFMGQCNGKRSSKPTTDSTSAVIIKQKEAENKVLVAEISELKEKLKADSIKIVQTEKEREIIKNQYIYLSDHVKTLPLNEAVLFMAGNFTDKREIKVQVEQKDTGVVISPTQAKEINVTYVSNGYLQIDNEFLIEELAYRVSSDSAMTQIIVKQEAMLNNQDNIIDVKSEQIAVMNKSIETLTKHYKGQKRQKYIYKFAAMVLLVFAAIK